MDLLFRCRRNKNKENNISRDPQTPATGPTMMGRRLELFPLEEGVAVVVCEELDVLGELYVLVKVAVISASPGSRTVYLRASITADV